MTHAPRATLADLDAIMALERASFPTDAWSDAMMREELASPHGWYVVVEEAGRLVGYAGLRAARGATDADIQTIAIAEAVPRPRSRPRAARRAAGEAARRGVHDVFLEVRADNPVAQALYASEGFVEVGRRPRYYQPDDVDAIVMRLDLRGWAAARATAVERRSAIRRDARERAREPRPNRSSSGIETSCDETGIGIVRGRTLLSNTIASSMDEHARYGGVVPEVAARAHLEALQPVDRGGARRGGRRARRHRRGRRDLRPGPRRRAHGRRRRGQGARGVARHARSTP